MPLAASIARSSLDAPLQTVRWVGGIDGCLVLIDQTRLPTETVELECRDAETVWEAIKSLRVRGAPAIGIAAAYGLVVALAAASKARPLDQVLPSDSDFFTQLHEAADYLASSRPTAVNLFWALDRQRRRAEALRGTANVTALLLALLDEAQSIEKEDREACWKIGKHGAKFLQNDQGVLTHCNAGALATADYGTALAVIYAAYEEGKRFPVYADETRPLLQGARLTAWELMQRGVDVTLICDSVAAQVMKEGKIKTVVVGADRIAANGDAANKIGTYSVAQLAAAHGIPFYVAAPTSTFDLSLSSGDQIPIEQRSSQEVTHWQGRLAAPEGVKVYNPAFDVTPARLIKALICEKGVIEPVNEQNVRAMLEATSKR